MMRRMAQEKQLIDLYNEHFMEFGWRPILENLHRRFVYKTRQQCSDKIKTLLRSGYAEKREDGTLLVFVGPNSRPRTGQHADGGGSAILTPTRSCT